MKDKKCVFCKILNAELPASFLWRDEFCAAFLDIQPINTGHILVIPLEHEPLLGDLDPEIVAHMLKIGQKMVQALRASSLPCEGVNLSWRMESLPDKKYFTVTCMFSRGIKVTDSGFILDPITANYLHARHWTRWQANSGGSWQERGWRRNGDLIILKL